MKSLKPICSAVFAMATTLALAPAAHAEAPAALSASVTIHADKPGATISPEIFGQFSEHLGHGIYGGIWVGKHSKIPNIDGFRKDVIGALKALHVPVVRWPGGCFADDYHWRNGIGPRSKRPTTVNTNWGGVPEPNSFGTDEFMKFVHMIGAKAYITGNLGTGTAGEMADWLKYLTSNQDTTLTRMRAANGHKAPYKVPYWAIGNESWGCGGNMRPLYYVDLFRRYSTFLTAPPGARPLIVASGGHDEKGLLWTKALMKDGGPNVGAISFHYYSRPLTKEWAHKGSATNFPESQWISTLVNAEKMDGYISENTAIMDKYDPKKRIGFFVDEWGTWYDTPPGHNPGFLFQQNTMRDAVVAATTLDIFEKHADRVRMANIAQTVNVLQAMILTDGPKMVLTPTYDVFKMYIPFQGATHLPSDVRSPNYSYDKMSVPAISIAAARGKAGELVYALTNLDPERAVNVTTTIDGVSPTSVEGAVLTAAKMDAHNSFAKPDQVHPVAFEGAHLHGGHLNVTLPPKSVVVLTMK